MAASGLRRRRVAGVSELSRVGFLEAEPYKWRGVKRLVTAERRKFGAPARPDSSRSSPSTYCYLPRKNLPLKGVSEEVGKRTFLSPWYPETSGVKVRFPNCAPG